MDQTRDNFYLNDSTKNISSLVTRVPVGIITFTSDWTIDFANDVFFKYAKLYQLESENIKGFNILDTELLKGTSLLNELKALEEGVPFEKVIKSITTFEGGILTLIIKATPLFEEEKFAGGILILEDLKIAPSFLKEKTLRTEQIENVLHNSNDLLLITDSEGQIKYAFGKLLSKLGISPVSLSDAPIDRVLPENIKNKIINALNSVSAEKKSQKIILKFALRDEEFIFECKIEPVLTWRGNIRHIFLFFSEISEFYTEKEELRGEVAELKQYQLITETVTDAVFAVDDEGSIFFWNRAAESLFGYSRSEVFGKFFGKALDVFDKEYFNVIKEELIKNNLWKITLTVYKKNGQKEIIEAKFSRAVQDRNIIVILCSNVTERAGKELQLKASEERFKDIVTKAAELICNITPEGNLTYANPAFCNALKYSAAEILNKYFHELVSPDFLKEHQFSVKTFDKTSTSEIQLNLVSKTKEEILVRAIISPVFEKNKLSYFNGIFTDITSKKQTQKNLQVFQSMFDAFQDGVAVEYEGKLILTNKIFPQIFGYSGEAELIGKDIIQLVNEEDIQRVIGYFDLLLHKNDIPRRFEFLGKRKDGIKFFAEMSLSTFVSEGKEYVVITTSDITERKRVQQAIKDSEEKYRNITENIDDFLFTFERTGVMLRPVFYTASVEKITGYSQADLLGDSKFILKIIYPDDFSALKKKLSSLLKSRIQLSGEFEFRIINKHGNIVWVRTKVNLHRDNEGKISRMYGLVSDISLRKKAEDDLTKSTDNLIKLNETKDRFISIISHDLRTPFSSILGFTDLLLSDKDLNEDERKQYIEFIQESSKSMLSLVNSLLDWTRLQTGRIRFEPERTEANKIIENSLNALSGVAFQKDIEISSSVGDDINIFVDKDLILQVFNNLISNAIKFTPQGGAIHISVKSSPKMRFLEFSIKDSGMGIKPENINKLFRIDTKFTSEGTAGEKGTGLGLSLVKEIIDKHGGTIWVESEFGSGSDFKFTLPVASANILLVDDSNTDRLLYSKILKNITPDYSIELAVDGKEAIEKIIQAPPALVITDHLMPKMSGYELILEIQKSTLKGKPPVIILSSDIDRNSIEEYHSLGIEYVFQKPVNLSSFKQAVEKSLRKGLLGI